MTAAANNTGILSTVNATLNQNFTIENQSVKIGHGSAKVLPAKTPVVEVSITQAKDPKSVQLFQKILTRLGTDYQANEKDTLDIYALYLGNKLKYGPLEQRRRKILAEAAESAKKPKTRNQMLKKQAPDLIQSNYARDCQ